MQSFVVSCVRVRALCRTVDAVQRVLSERGILVVSAGAMFFLHLWETRRDYHLHAIITVFPLSGTITGFSRENSATFLSCTSSSSSIHNTGTGAGMQIKLQKI